jgi:hypothetical protein
MSALPPKADIAQRGRHLRFVPKPEVVHSANEEVRTSQTTERTSPALWNQLLDPVVRLAHGGTVSAYQNAHVVFLIIGEINSGIKG